MGAGNSDPGRSLILEIAGDGSINLKWQNSLSLLNLTDFFSNLASIHRCV